jgi:hypothetical protein
VDETEGKRSAHGKTGGLNWERLGEYDPGINFAEGSTGRDPATLRRRDRGFKTPEHQFDCTNLGKATDTIIRPTVNTEQ